MLFLKLLAYFLKIRRNLHKFYHFFFYCNISTSAEKMEFHCYRIRRCRQNVGLAR